MKNNQTTLQAIEALDSIDHDPLMRATVIKKCVTDMTPFLHKLTAVQVAELQATLAQDRKTIPGSLARVWIINKMIRVLEKLLDAAVLDANRQGVVQDGDCPRVGYDVSEYSVSFPEAECESSA